MTNKHTSGPWEAVGNLVRSPMHQPEGLPRGVQIAECMDGYSQPFTEEAKANARLISAAPELLEALIDILHNSAPGYSGDPVIDADFSRRYKQYSEKALKVVAKVTGEAQ